MSPILVRPVREQLEHDRLIRHLLTKYKKKTNEVTVNLGDEQVVPVRIGNVVLFPDLVISDAKKVSGLVEVETSESVNNLEAMAQWVHFSRGRVPFHLYIPVPAYDAAKRLCDANHVSVGEIWTYRPLNEGFDLVRMSHDAHAANQGRMATIVKLPPKPAPEPPPPPPPPARPEARPGAKGAPPARVAVGKGVPAKPVPGKPSPVSAAAVPAKGAPAKAAPPVKATPMKPAAATSKPAPKAAPKPAPKKLAAKKVAPKPKAAARPKNAKSKSTKAGRRK